MRNCNRGPIPDSLNRHGARWTKELLDEIERCAKTGEKVKEKFYTKYATTSVKEGLDNIYKNFCCYCEAQIGIVDYPHIEHCKPKRQKNGVPIKAYPELTYEWENLHLACTRCNVAKGTKYDEVNPILDSVLDTNINTHFKYDASLGGVYWYPKTLRGKTTADHADLNRDGLTQARQEIWLKITNLITDIKENPGNPSNDLITMNLRKKVYGPYGSMIKYLLDTLLPENE